MAYETPLTIAEVMKDITANKYVLPSIQREYVWDTDQIEALFDSLMRDYSIGTFLFWEISKEHVNDYDFYGFIRNYHEYKGAHNKKVDLKGLDGVTAVLDGQQRLTSIYIGLKGTYAYKLKYMAKKNQDAYPTRKLYLNLLSNPTDSSNEYEFKFLTNKEVQNDENTYWFEVGEILNMKQDGDVAMFVTKNIGFSKEFEYTEEQTIFAINALSKLYNIINKVGTISYYREKTVKLDKVLNIFIRVNSGGTPLSYSDLLLSIASAQWENHDAREEIIEFVDDVNAVGEGFKINKDFVLKTALVLSDFTDIAFKVDNFNKQNMTKIENNWDNIKKAIKQAVLLVSSFGYSGETLTSNNALIPIAYYLFINGMPDNFVDSGTNKNNKDKIKKWLIRSLLKKTFSGQPDNVIRPIREILKVNGTNEFPLDSIIDKFKGTNKSIQFTDEDIEEFLLKLKYGKSDTLSTLMLLYPSLDFSNKFHEDHMYPKSKFTKTYLQKHGVPEEQLDWYIATVNDISNLQLLAAQLNEEKLATDFDEWFNEQHPTDTDKIQYRTVNYLPDMDYSYENYPKFIEERKALLKKQLSAVLL
ncbi:Uncharacterized conserved protein, contains ParB-like and HNH nuclease domains [Peptoniphilus asaccharolyticus DSM 20463]|uniref:Uncharacterized conserved protein, contains ParB-like and HNH nuclease domains n=1 Tax=Peptoniphilus asaccharolyticus DSM 20463 TaxID=573058 RepID=A0A1W1V177_PEPAS|nr:DUF262 domain-containing protein [Peptoniphilus asaccharolyticus]MBL7575439.1 DUF262 domain-containing protein [Peptoniphilus asaccharolyticus]SMB86764.1 Uncharacterized conserved protein, contains ParB-like and HNH nuclease domains [Peptoniphilus asaccharolyticus DSM 20463]